MRQIALAAARVAASIASPGARRGRLSILIYHRVLAHPDPLSGNRLDARVFDRQVAALKTAFNILPLSEAVARLREGTLPARSAAITFDDGYADNHDVALPILLKHRVPAAFFVASGYLDGGRMWNDTVIEAVRVAPGPVLDLSDVGLGRYPLGSLSERRAAVTDLIGRLKHLPYEKRQALSDRLADAAKAPLPHDLMLTSDQLRTIAASGMEIGGHTMTHPILSRVAGQTAESEIDAGKKALEQIIGRRITLFAYPNGKPNVDYSAEHVDMVRRLGFEAAVSTAWGVARRDDDPFQLPRFTPWDRDPSRFLMRLVQNQLRTRFEKV